MKKSIARRSWFSERKSWSDNCAKIDECPDMLQSVEDVLKEKWQQKLKDVEQRRNDLSAEH